VETGHSQPVQEVNKMSMSEEKSSRKPPWLKVTGFGGTAFNEVSGLLKRYGLNTVCQAANCPNRGECFSRGTATFLILGPLCTRNCRFCDVRTGQPRPPDPDEPSRVAQAALSLKLKHVVITSVTRDDLPDGGAGQFAETIRCIRELLPKSRIEVLTPDFRGAADGLRIVMEARPDIFNHNLETVPRLYPSVRPGADYERSLNLLNDARERFGAVTKSGLMVGLGETTDELEQVFADLAQIHVPMLTIGQYLAPSKEHLAVERYLPPEEFEHLRDLAVAAGIPKVFSAPLVRSSYLADELASRQ
jgi:lipoic acid synthetase